MADNTKTWPQVLTEADDGTARVIITVQKEDACQAACGSEVASGEHLTRDYAVACSLYATELELYRVQRFPYSSAPETGPPSSQAPPMAKPLPPPQPPLPRPAQQSQPLLPALKRKRDAADAPEAAEDEATKISEDGAPLVLFTCVSCRDDFDADHCTRAPCGHHFCDKDLNRLFKIALKHEVSYPPRCCKDVVPYEDISHLLKPSLRSAFSAKREELDDPKPVYCHVPTCSTYIPHINREENLAQCPTCEKELCMSCKQTMHEGDCAEDKSMKETMQLAKEKEWQQCRSCDRIVELTLGCNHMKCFCKAEFCYECGVTWKNCRCPGARERNLLARGRQITRRERGTNLADILAGLRMNPDCNTNGTNHNYRYVEGDTYCDICGDWLRLYIYRCRDCHVQSCNWCRIGLL